MTRPTANFRSPQFVVAATLALSACTALPLDTRSDEDSDGHAVSNGGIEQTVEIQPRFSGKGIESLVPHFEVRGVPFSLVLTQIWDPATRVYQLGLSLRNDGTAPLARALRFKLTALPGNRLRAVGADNGQPGGGALWDLSQYVGDDGVITPGEVTAVRNLTFVVQGTPEAALRGTRILAVVSADSAGTAYPATAARDPSTSEITAGQGIGLVAINYKVSPTTQDLTRLNIKFRLRGQWLHAETGWYIAFTSDTTQSATLASASAIAQDPLVAAAEPVPLGIGTAVPTPTETLGWAYTAIEGTNAVGAWSVEEAAGRIPGQGITIGYLDTGIDQGHPELQGQITGAVDARILRSDPDDHFSHGTSVAGTLAAASNGKVAVGGAYGAKVFSIKVADSRPNYFNFAAYAWDAIEGLKFAAGRTDLDVLNISWGIPWYARVASPAFIAAIEAAGDKEITKILAHGTVIVASAGNRQSLTTPFGILDECHTPTGGVIWPARNPGVIAVSGVSQGSNFLHDGSCFGPEVDIAAPYEVWSIAPSSIQPGGVLFNGTSAAAPVVAAALAVIKARSSGTLAGQSLRDELLQHYVKVVAVTCPAIECGAGALYFSSGPPPNAGAVAGQVTSPQFGIMGGVRVTVNPGNLSTLTDDNGDYIIQGVAPGPVVVSLTITDPDCSPPTPLAVQVIAGQTSAADFSVDCLGPDGPLVALTSGAAHTCALAQSGTAFCWGSNSSGQLGDPNVSTAPNPIPVSGGLLFASIVAGSAHTCGLDGSGLAYCWGSNNWGQLGDGTTTSRSVPVRVAGNRQFSQLIAGSLYTCGRASGGTTYCWGLSQRMDDTSDLVPTLFNTSIAFASLAGGSQHTCGLDGTGKAYCWGNSAEGALGAGPITVSSTPQAVLGGLRFAALSLGGFHSCGITTQGTGYCWGFNGAGQLGDGSNTDQNVPVVVTGSARLDRIEAGGSHTCGVDRGNSVLCWGDNSSGQLGDGTTTSRSFPAAINTTLGPFVELTAGSRHSCALLSNAAVCWGENSAGQLGDGQIPFRSLIPVYVNYP